MQYELLITREGEAILESVLTADEVVDLLRKQPATVVEERIMNVVEVIEIDRKGGGSGKKRKLKKGTKVCKKCGEPGHMQKTCPNGRNVPPDALQGRHTQGKSCCGSVGQRHKKGCPEADKPTPPGKTIEVAPASVAMGPDRYKMIRAAMHDKEFQSAKYALVNRQSPREVNFAVRSKDYGDYLEIRQS